MCRWINLIARFAALSIALTPLILPLVIFMHHIEVNNSAASGNSDIKLEILLLRKADYGIIQKGDELEFDGKRFDVHFVKLKGAFCEVLCEEDEDEKWLLNPIKSKDQKTFKSIISVDWIFEKIQVCISADHGNIQWVSSVKVDLYNHLKSHFHPPENFVNQENFLPVYS